MSVKVAEASELTDLAIELTNMKQRMAKLESEFRQAHDHVPSLHRRLTDLEISLEQISHGKRLPTGVIDWRMQRVEEKLSQLSKASSTSVCDTNEKSPSFLVYSIGERTGNPWSNEEERWLTKHFKSALKKWAVEEPPTRETLEIIKSHLGCIIGRTALAVDCRLKQLGYDWV